MDEYLSFDKKEKGCSVYITINCGKDCERGEIRKPDKNGGEPDGSKDNCKPIDWEKYIEKKPYPESHCDKNGIRCPSFVTSVTNNLFVDGKKRDDKK